MNEILEVPATPENITTLALATDPCDTLALLVSIKAISALDLQRVLETKTFLMDAHQKLIQNSPIADETDEISPRYLLLAVQWLLNKSENQAYLAYQLKIELSPGNLINALSDLIFSSSKEGYCRPWKIPSFIREQTYGIEEERVWTAGNTQLMCLLSECQLAPSYFSSRNIFGEYLWTQVVSSRAHV